MKKILIGFILIFLDFDLNFGSVSIGLLPDFIGYHFLKEGITEFENRSSHFKKVEELIMPFFILSLIIYAFDLLTITAAMGYASLILTLLSAGMGFYASYHIIHGFSDMGINTKKLETLWKIMLCAHAITLALNFIHIISILVGLVALVPTVLFLSEFNNIKDAKNGGAL